MVNFLSIHFSVAHTIHHQFTLIILTSLDDNQIRSHLAVLEDHFKQHVTQNKMNTIVVVV